MNILPYNYLFSLTIREYMNNRIYACFYNINNTGKLELTISNFIRHKNGDIFKIIVNYIV